MGADRDFYAILSVPRDCDDEALKRAYKKAAVKFHPDKHASKSEAEKKAAEEKFKDVAEAMEVLSDKDKRAVYDRYGEAGLKAGGPAREAASGGGGMPPGFGSFTGGAGGTTFSFSTGGTGGGMDAARAQEMFESIFGSGGFGGAGGLGGGGVHDRRSAGGRKGGRFMMDADDPFASLMGGIMGNGIAMGDGALGGMSQRGARRRRASADAAPVRVDRLEPGTAVRLEGLSSAEHNGAVGTVDAFDESKARYVVTLHGGASLAVRPANCVQVVTEARVMGTSQDGLNGRTASTATFDRASKRYRCEGLKADGTVLSLKPENVVLPTQTRVTIDGVESRPALNGRIGAVRAVHEDTQRYDVHLSSGEAVRVRFGAVAAC